MVCVKASFKMLTRVACVKDSFKLVTRVVCVKVSFELFTGHRTVYGYVSFQCKELSRLDRNGLGAMWLG